MNVCVAQCRPPRDLDSKATIKIDDKTFEVEANDLQYMCTLGRGAYGVVEKVRHRLTDTIMAVKVHHHWHIFFGMGGYWFCCFFNENTSLEVKCSLDLCLRLNFCLIFISLHIKL